MTIAKNKAQVAADAAARTKEFQADKRAKALRKHRCIVNYNLA